MLVFRLISVPLHFRTELPWPAGNLERANIQHTLENSEGQQLVFVRYSANHVVDFEWVYNHADIDGIKVSLGAGYGGREEPGAVAIFQESSGMDARPGQFTAEAIALFRNPPPPACTIDQKFDRGCTAYAAKRTMTGSMGCR